MKYLFLILFMYFLNGCSIATDIYDGQKDRIRNEEVKAANEKNFEKYGACVISYNADISLELLKTRDLTKRIGSGFNKYGNYNDGFWIYTRTDTINNRVEISTMNDIVVLPLNAGARVMSKSKKLGAAISNEGNLSVGYFFKTKSMCLNRDSYSSEKMGWIDSKSLN